MARRFLQFLLPVLLLVVFGCSKEPNTRPKPVPSPQPSVKVELQQEDAEEEPIKAATPEDPGPIATVVAPMAVWARQAEAAKRAQARKAEKEAQASQPPRPEDHVVTSASPDPSHFLHKVFAVQNYSQFSFTVPPNIVNPILHGNFRSFINSADSSGSKAANVDVLLLNEKEFVEFANGRRGNATYELDSSHSQAIDYAVPATHDHPQPYHLVFCNPASETRFVDADFTVSFE